jgi:hypothetical protein
MIDYYHEFKNDFCEAANMCERLLSLATQTGNIRRHGQGLDSLAWLNRRLGRYSIVQMDAHESQKLFRVFGDLHGEAGAAYTEAVCWSELGHYKQSLSEHQSTKSS